MRNDTKPEGRTMRELHAIVEADTARFQRIADVWNDLLEHEQLQLVALAESLATNDEPVVRDPESWQAVADAGRKYA